MDERILTRMQEQVIRLCHHDFGGLPLAETAKIMGLNPGQVAALLKGAEEKAPRMFPILMREEKVVFDWWRSGKEEPPQAVYDLIGNVKKIMASLRKKGFLLSKHKTVRFNVALHEGHIRRRF